MADADLPSAPGWYPDPYHLGSKRWFDGSQWTTHAVSSEILDPDAVVEAHFDPRNDTEVRQEEWEDGFPKWDVAVPRPGEPGFRGGIGGTVAFPARLAMRYGTGVPNTAKLFAVLTVVFGVLAVADSVDRVVLAAVAGALFLTTALIAIRSYASRRHWDRVGAADD